MRKDIIYYLVYLQKIDWVVNNIVKKLIKTTKKAKWNTFAKIKTKEYGE